MTWEAFLQLLNIPVFIAVVVLIFRAGRVIEKLEDHARRLALLEENYLLGRRHQLREPH